MHPYVLVPLLACIVSATVALHLWLRDPSHRSNYPIIGVSAAAAFWACCEVAWNVAGSEEVALFLVRLSAVGWIALGPLTLHAIHASRERRSRGMERLLGSLYAASGVGLAVTWSTPWMIADVARTSWGWSAIPGPALPFQYALVAAPVTAAVVMWERVTRRLSSGASRGRRLVTVALLVPLCVASLTDILLPLAGHYEVPRLGTASLALLGALHVVAFYRYGDSPLVAEGFTWRVLESVPDGIAALSLSGRVRAVNGRLCEMIGLPRARILGRCAGEFLRPAPRFDPPREELDAECELLPAMGPPIAASASTILEADNLGVARGVVLVVRDLREVVALRNNLVTSGRLAAVGELAAGIAHEINNPVTYVRVNLSVLREHWRTLAKALDGAARPEIAELVAEGEELIDESLEGVNRASAIVRDVREFSHAGGAGRELTDLNQLLEQTLRVAGPQIPPGAAVERAFGALPLVECEPQRLKQVFLNLVVNAAQALEGQGTIRIASQARDGTVTVSVEDDGSGIAPEILDRIFDPFFTTKPVGVGTGLGLAIAFGIVQQHRGRIDVESTPGRGTRFRVSLPAWSGDPPAESPTTAAS
jgi:signal transduction histidine kinase